jgi:NhaP-type Na+/H+ or K+/H+ antiporter
MIDLLLAVVGALAIAVAALSEQLRRFPLSEPLLALLLGVALGPAATGLLQVPSIAAETAAFHEGTRLLLAVSVIAVALRYPITAARSRLRPVALLVVVALPVMALASAGAAALALGVGLGSALLLGAALSPTDPVLASSVVTGGPAVRDLRERDRQVLSLESGANDGLALPLVLLALSVAGATTPGSVALEGLWQVTGAVVVGAVAGWLGGMALRQGEEHGAVDPAPRLLFTVLLAFAVLGASGLAHVDGILAVFVAGLAFNAAATGPERSGSGSIDEAINRFLVLPLFVVFGAALPWEEWATLGWRGPAFLAAVLLLRRLPVILLLRRPLGFSTSQAVFVGWFGPIGVSAIFYLTLLSQRMALPPEVLAAGALVVAGSTVAHGLTTSPGRRLYRRWT